MNLIGYIRVVLKVFSFGVQCRWKRQLGNERAVLIGQCGLSSAGGRGLAIVLTAGTYDPAASGTVLIA